MERIDTLVIGAGQAGLSASYWLTQAGRDHLVLEQAADPAHVWKAQRWDSFTLVTPNWTMNLPGAAFEGPDREGFTPLAGVIDYFNRYVEDNHPPLQCNTRIDAVIPMNSQEFAVKAGGRRYKARNVIIATGHEQQPRIPPAARQISSGIVQLHSSAYRNPESLPPGAVLVVGTAQSGGQIAEELYQSGRKVYLCVSNAGRAPRRYRGKDGFEWLFLSGFLDLPPEKFPAPREKFVPPHLSGKNGGHTLNLHQFARDGVTLLGHFQGASGTKTAFTPDMHECLARADGFEQRITQMIDGYIQANGLEAPEEQLPQLRDGFDQPVLERLDLQEVGITAIVWATGFIRDYGIVHAPVVDDKGFPIQDCGVSPVPGLYFVGMPWMPGVKSAQLTGVGESARQVVAHLTDA